MDSNLHSRATYTGYKSPEMDRVIEQGVREGDPKKRYEIYRELQRLFYTEVPFIKHGDTFGLQAQRAAVKGYVPWYSTRFWNVWLEKQ